MAELTYRDQVLNPEPINIPLADVAKHLIADSSVVVILEPGDATRYTYHLCPMNVAGVRGHLRGIGIPSDQAHYYILVTRIDTMQPRSGLVRLDRKIGRWMTCDIEPNPWSAEVLAWFLINLQEVMEAEA